LSLKEESDMQKTASAFIVAVEKIEIGSVLEERAKACCEPRPFSDEVKEILASNPDLFYERSLFLQVCEARAFGRQQERVGELSDNSTMEEVMMLFLANSSREEFLEYYIPAFEAALAL